MSLLHPFVHKFASYMWYIYVCPKRTYWCIKWMRGQQVLLRERIPNAMFVTLSTYFYVGRTNVLDCSCRITVYTNTDDTNHKKAVNILQKLNAGEYGDRGNIGVSVFSRKSQLYWRSEKVWRLQRKWEMSCLRPGKLK